LRSYLTDKQVIEESYRACKDSPDKLTTPYLLDYIATFYGRSVSKQSLHNTLGSYQTRCQIHTGEKAIAAAEALLNETKDNFAVSKRILGDVFHERKEN